MAGKRSAIYGEARTQDGLGMPMVIERGVVGMDKGGYAPETLDPVIQRLIDNADSGATLLQRFTPMLAAIMTRLDAEVKKNLDMVTAVPVKEGEVPPPHVTAATAMVLEMAEKVTSILEKINKMTMQSVRSKDDATRLRTFLATGDTERKGLEELGENQLRRIINEAAAGFRSTDPESTT